jgi:FixJ family two-component response regulator
VGETLALPAPEGIVFVVDDDPAVREALGSLLRSVGLRSAAFSSAVEFLRFPRPPVPACMVLDVRMPGLSGLDLQRALSDSGDAPPIIFITGHGDIPMTVRAMKAGAVEFLSKPFRDQDLLDAIRAGLQRDAGERSTRAEQDLVRARYRSLTAREREVVPYLMRGLLNKQIAAELGISEVTIKVHRRRILLKMGATSLPALVRALQKLPAISP